MNCNEITRKRARVADMSLLFSAGLLEPNIYEGKMTDLDWECDSDSYFQDKTWGQRVLAGYELMDFLMGISEKFGAIHARFLTESVQQIRETIDHEIMEPMMHKTFLEILSLHQVLVQRLGIPENEADLDGHLEALDALDRIAKQYANHKDLTFRTPTQKQFDTIRGGFDLIRPYIHVVGLPLFRIASQRIAPGKHHTIAMFTDGINYPTFSKTYAALEPLQPEEIKAQFNIGGFLWTFEPKIEARMRELKR